MDIFHVNLDSQLPLDLKVWLVQSTCTSRCPGLLTLTRDHSHSSHPLFIHYLTTKGKD